jgi:hypothetical protein
MFSYETRWSSWLPRQRMREGNTMSFGLYAIGFSILTIGLIYGAFLLHLPTHWIVVGAIVLLGIGILSGVKATRQRDSAA